METNDYVFNFFENSVPSLIKLLSLKFKQIIF